MHRDGSFYIGDYKKGMSHGKGMFNSKHGSVYNGEWVKDK